MKKGFTLVEIIGVIVILSIILTICFPVVTKIINNGRQTSYNSIVEDIKKAASDWCLLHPNLTPTKENTLTIDVKTLKQEGLLNKNIKNPLTGKLISGESKIVISYSKGSYVYTVNIVDMDNNSQSINGPQMVLVGDSIVYFEVNQDGIEYVDAGCNATDTNNNSLVVSTSIINELDKIVSNIDESKISSYKIVYEAKDSNNNISSVTRTIIINDTIEPVINTSTLTVSLSDYNNNLLNTGITVTDNSGETIIPTFDTPTINNTGTYHITYTAKDSSDNSSSIVRTIIVN